VCGGVTEGVLKVVLIDKPSIAVFTFKPVSVDRGVEVLLEALGSAEALVTGTAVRH